MDNLILYLITLKLPKDFEDIINPIKKKFDPGSFRKLSSHITLFPPFEFYGDITGLIHSVEGEVANLTPFRLYTDRLSSFGRRVIFIGVKPSPELTTLYQRVAGVMHSQNISLKRKAREKYIPHLTIIQRCHNTESFFKAKEEMLNLNWPPKTTVQGINIYTWDKGHWELVRELLF